MSDGDRSARPVGGVLAAAAIAAGSIVSTLLRPKVNLTAETVEIPAPPDALIEHLALRMAQGPDVIAGDGRRVVRRFAGTAGPFRYRTVEVVSFESDAITFEHLRGPFSECHERFQLGPTGDGCRLVHSGHFRLRGGLWLWPLARFGIRPAFERHVRDHVEQLGSELTGDGQVSARSG